MGLKDKLKKYNEEHKDDGFHPLELTEGNVQAVFNRCLATEDTSPDNIFSPGLAVFVENQKIRADMFIDFKADMVKKDKRTIQYLYGQLEIVHNDSVILNPQNAIQKYDKTAWTSDWDVLMKFFHLGRVAYTVLPFKQDLHSMVVDIQPTLSPKDPAFPAWWEAHKAEWEQ